MNHFIKSEISITGSNQRQITIDISYFKNRTKKPILVFSHGFKGFKDWGHFNLVAKEYAESGFVFIKFNFSHNGTTPDRPTDFSDPEAFGKNNYSLELNDLGYVIDFIYLNPQLSDEADFSKIYLIGHSRGGAISLLKSIEDQRVKKVITWAAVADTKKRITAYNAHEWKKNGVVYIENTRTHQQLPLYYQFVEDFQEHKTRLDLLNALTQINIPVLIFHGATDNSVSYSEAELLQKGIKNSVLHKIAEGDHTFGGKHPYEENRLPLPTIKIISASMPFLLS
jgi:pimeloyl-ACP methyl ester carboxylesterase